MKYAAVIMVLLVSAILAQEDAGGRVLKVPGQYATISQACWEAVVGDTVAVQPRTYYEGCIYVPEGVTVLGMGSDSTEVRVIPPEWEEAFAVGSGAERVVLENMEIHERTDWRPIITNSNQDLVIQRCLLWRDASGTTQYGAVVLCWSGNATIRRSCIDFGYYGAMWEWVFEPYTIAGHFVLQDCVVLMEPSFYMSFAETPAGSVYEFSNNTIPCRVLTDAYSGHREFAMYLANNIVGAFQCSQPAYQPRVLEHRHNCSIWEAIPEACGYQVGNFAADPLFCDPAAGDYRLQPGSPCIGAGEHGENVGARLGICGVTGVAEESGARGSDLWISRAWPNPTSSGVSLMVRSASGISGPVPVLDVLGNVVGRASVAREGGTARVRWDGRTVAGMPAPSGVYYLSVPQAEGPRASRRVVVLR